ncbi:hypothetical protein [Corynebacterium striatum]|uniref:hypothetical protein n=1 Tax=Corynebacterium striatum TaxID=43770 RepID=UPI003B59CBCE
MNDVDILKFAIGAVTDVLGDVWVADHLPRADELEHMTPAVVIDLLPGSELTPWGGDTGENITDFIAFDVEVVGNSRAQCTPVADNVRAALHQLPYLEGSGVKSVDCPRFSTREDINPTLRVLGATADLMVIAT